MTTEETAERGRRVSALLEDTLNEAFRRAEEEIIAEWKATADPEAQRMAWAKVQAIPAVQEILRRIVADGEYAREVLRRRQ